MRPLPSLLPLLLLAGCSTAPTAELDVNDGRLARCPASPNCVSSQAGDNGSLIAPLRYHVSPQLAWDALVAVVSAQPRATLVTRQAGYLHAEFRSALFRFVDDVEFLAAADEPVIHVRSASRVGYWDLGANRARVERLRQEFQQRLDNSS
jgi:uncharacterized protein (DUF1499 family)